MSRVADHRAVLPTVLSTVLLAACGAGADAVAGLAGDRLRLLDRDATGTWLVDRWSAQWRRGRVQLVVG